jgi:Rieske Fe-S protein
MDRKTFIKNSCITCMGLALGGSLLQSCAGAKYVKGTLNDNGILVGLSEFEVKDKAPRSYLIVRHDDLKYPVCVYNLGGGKYSALLMSCTHQGVELQASGDQLTCPAHGSEFDKLGNVTQSPAASPLRSFPVSVEKDQLFIDLRKKTS